MAPTRGGLELARGLPTLRWDRAPVEDAAVLLPRPAAPFNKKQRLADTFPAHGRRIRSTEPRADLSVQTGRPGRSRAAADAQRVGTAVCFVSFPTFQGTNGGGPGRGSGETTWTSQRRVTG